jgi:hypothetical protein
MEDRSRTTLPPAARRPSRRAFLGALAVAPVVPAALAPQTAVPPASPPVSPDAAVAEALAEAVKREFGSQLDPAGLDAVRKELARGLERASRLRQAARLDNADAPVTRFEARPPAASETGGRG